MNGTFQAMMSKLRAHNLAFPDPHRDHDLRLDEAIVSKWGFIGAEYLWVVKPTGTHLAQVGIDHADAIRSIQRQRKDGHLGGSQAALFHVAGQSVRSLSEDGALAILRRPLNYALDDGYVVLPKDGKRVFRYSVIQSRANAKAPTAAVRFSTIEGFDPKAIDLAALNSLSGRIAAEEARSLFVEVSAVLLDGEQLYTAFARTRAASTKLSQRSRPRVAA